MEVVYVPYTDAGWDYGWDSYLDKVQFIKGGSSYRAFSTHGGAVMAAKQAFGLDKGRVLAVPVKSVNSKGEGVAHRKAAGPIPGTVGAKPGSKMFAVLRMSGDGPYHMISEHDPVWFFDFVAAQAHYKKAKAAEPLTAAIGFTVEGGSGTSGFGGMPSFMLSGGAAVPKNKKAKRARRRSGKRKSTKRRPSAAAGGSVAEVLRRRKQ